MNVEQQGPLNVKKKNDIDERQAQKMQHNDDIDGS